MENFGEFLKNLRKEKMTQRELAERLGVGYPYISKLENNKEKTPSDLLLYKIAAILEVDKTELFKKANRVPKDVQGLLLENDFVLDTLMKDIEKKEAPRKIRGHKEKNAITNILRTPNITLLINPATGEIVEANESAVDFYKYSLKELRRKRIIDLNILPEAIVKEKMHKAALLNQNFFDFQHRIKSGEVKEVQVFSTPFSIGLEKYLCSTIIPKENESKKNIG